MSLNIDNVTVKAKDKALISNISFNCQPGTMVGIVGENGAGKTTVLNTLAGLTEPSVGDVLINQKSIFKQSPTTLAALRAVLPQSSDLAFPLNAIEIVKLALSFSACKHQHQAQILEQSMSLFDVQKLADQNYLTLSGGEKQRIQLARVTAQILSHKKENDAQYLLLDEPISALDLYQQYQTLQSIKELSRSGVGVITILHDLNLASMYCDHIVILKNGTVFDQGCPSKVITQDNIRRAFNLDISLQQHPDTKTPFIIPSVNDKLVRVNTKLHN